MWAVNFSESPHFIQSYGPELIENTENVSPELPLGNALEFLSKKGCSCGISGVIAPFLTENSLKHLSRDIAMNLTEYYCYHYFSLFMCPSVHHEQELTHTETTTCFGRGYLLFSWLFTF